jgi:hypothetical protein
MAATERNPEIKSKETTASAATKDTQPISGVGQTAINVRD